jgi:hypothetical protein
MQHGGEDSLAVRPDLRFTDQRFLQRKGTAIRQHKEHHKVVVPEQQVKRKPFLSGKLASQGDIVLPEHPTRILEAILHVGHSLFHNFFNFRFIFPVDHERSSTPRFFLITFI